MHSVPLHLPSSPPEKECRHLGKQPVLPASSEAGIFITLHECYTFSMNENITGLYKHFKGGLYEVVGVAKHSETLEEMVLYHHQGESELWVRPKDMFFGTKEIDGVSVQRFEKIED